MTGKPAFYPHNLYSLCSSKVLDSPPSVSYTLYSTLEIGSAESEELMGFHRWEVRKELQDAFNALINAAGQAGKHKLAESLFSEVISKLPCRC